MADASQGAQARLALDTTGTIDTGSVPVEFLSHTMARTGSILDGGGIRGTRSAPQERSRIGTSTVAGSISMNPSPNFLDEILPLILGGAESTDTFPLAETISSFSLGADLVSDTFRYDGCYINRAVFKGTAQGFITLDLDIIGKTISDLTFDFSTLIDTGLAANDAPYVMSDSVLTLASVNTLMMDWEIEIDNQLDARFTNSLTATSITPQDRIITLRCTTPWSSVEIPLYGNAAHGSGATESTPITDGAMVITNGNMSTTFTFGDLRIDSVTPSIPGKTEVPLNIVARARSTSTTKELVVTHDGTA